MRTEVLCIFVLRVASGPRVKLVSCSSALNPPYPLRLHPGGYFTDHSKAVVPVLVVVFVALWFILRGDLFNLLSCVCVCVCVCVCILLLFNFLCF